MEDNKEINTENTVDNVNEVEVKKAEEIETKQEVNIETEKLNEEAENEIEEDEKKRLPVLIKLDIILCILVILACAGAIVYFKILGK